MAEGVHFHCQRLHDEARRRQLVSDGFHFGSTASRAASMLDEFHTHPNALAETNHPGLRRTLLAEEYEELVEALQLGDPAKIARELADVLYVVYGTAWVHGIDLDAALEEIHRAAMDKMRAGVRRADGKIMKPPGFQPPDMTAAIDGVAALAAERSADASGGNCA